LKLYRAGRELAEIHLNYENQPPYIFNTAKVIGAETGDYHVHKMKFNAEHTEIIYNEKIKIVDIPARANEYVVNGRSPLEWIVERYQEKTDKASGITNDPNDWCAAHGEDYILKLILSCITVSLKTLEIVENLPTVDFE
jgi:predicted helicase